jgi:hypothetical protein
MLLAIDLDMLVYRQLKNIWTAEVVPTLVNEQDEPVEQQLHEQLEANGGPIVVVVDVVVTCLVHEPCVCPN